jgi:predicted nucleic acid-binding protein
MAGQLILDTGALIGWQRNDPRVWRFVAQAAERGDSVVVPAAVVAECVRGGDRDAPIRRLLAAARVPLVSEQIAVRAAPVCS